MIKILLQEKKFQRLLLAFLAIVPFEYFSLTGVHLPQPVEVIAFFAIALIFGRKIFAKGVTSLLSLRFSNINLLMTIAVMGAFYLGELEEAAIIVILFSLGEFLEDFGIEKSKSALQALVEKTPKTATLKGASESAPIESVAVGSIIVVKHGGIVPLDGVVSEGTSLVDESSVTGEPLPKTKVPGDTVFAGCVVSEGYLEITTTKAAKDSTLQKILDLTFAASKQKSKAQLFIQKFASIYTPAVLAISILLVVVPVFVFDQPFAVWLAQALTLLIISCPCALVISTPVSVFSAVGNASKRGVVIKGGRFLEELGKVRVIAFDKTRTITKGEPVVTDVIGFNGATRESVLSCLAGMETFSEHPIAKSVVAHAVQEGIEAHAHEAFTAASGKGIQAKCLVCTDSHHCAGTLKYIQEEHGPVDPDIVRAAEGLEKDGKTLIFVSDGTRVIGIVAVADVIKEDAASAISELNAIGVDPIMLTGDTAPAAHYVAAKTGIQKVYASLLPQDKAKKIEQLKRDYGSVAMVGDGVNDAPSLALSDVGIAMGAAGSDFAIENADIAIMNDKLSFLPTLIGLSRRMNGIIRFNVSAAILVKFAFIGLAILGYGSLIGAIVVDVGVTILVILNALRLFNAAPQKSSAQHASETLV
ncbi:MAG: heavy metal translocating P-type ATPase [Minisyncoccota bacterium]